MSKKGENIYKRKDGRWEARYIKDRDLNGKAKYGYCYAKTYHEVKEKVNHIKVNLIKDGVYESKKQNKLLSHYCDQWLLLKRSTIKQSTYVKYALVIEKWIKPSLGNIVISKINSIVIEQFSYDLIHKYNLSIKTVKDILSLLHSIIKYCTKFVPKLKQIDIIYPKAEYKVMRVLTRSEQKILIDYLLTDLNPCKFGVLFTLYTGLRIGEICALQWKNINLDDGLVFINATMLRIQDFESNSHTKTKIIITDPKSFSSSRVIPLSDYILNLCNQFKADNEAYVLTGTNKYLEPRTLQNKFSKYCKECNLEGVHFHTLRHTFATRCIEVDFEIKSLSEILGHANTQITLQRYVHSSLDLKRDNIRKLNKLDSQL